MRFELDSAREVLGRTPRLLDAWLRGLPEAWARADEGPGTWSAFDVVGHLIHGERTDWMPRARIILAHGSERPFEPFDRFAQMTAVEESLEQRLDTFAELRRENLAALAALDLSDEQLALEGRHPELGTVTLRELLATWVAHDLTHVAQIARVLAGCHRGEVGPWSAYLPLLGER